MEDRLLTICGQYNASNKKVPVLTLKGTWFDEAGFKIGDRVCVSRKDGSLVLENKGHGFGKPYPDEIKKVKKRTKNAPANG